MNQVRFPVMLMPWQAALIIVPIFALVIAYLMGGVDIAEMHVWLRGFSFPIFIGELVLGWSVCIFIVSTRLKWVFIDQWIKIYGIFIGYVIFRALYDFVVWGPLAFRHAAMFYYSLFALIVMSVFNWNWLKNQKLVVGLMVGLLLIQMFFATDPNDWLMWAVFTSILCLRIKNSRTAVVLGIIFVFINSPLKLVDGGRNHLVGLGAVLVFLALCAYCLVQTRKWRVVVILVFCLMGYGVIHFADKNSIKSMSNFSYVINEYKAQREIVKENLKTFIPTEIKVQLFVDNKAERNKRQLNQKINKTSIETQPINVGIKNERVVERANRSDQVLDKKMHVDHGRTRHGLSEDINQELSQERHLNNKKQENVQQSSQVLNKIMNLIDIPQQKPLRDMEKAYAHIYFRLFIWEDMLEELNNGQWWWGVGLGKPQRSKSIEYLDWAKTEWREAGWITPHNSWLHMVYRLGVVGILWVLGLWLSWIGVVISFIKRRSWLGLMLSGIWLYWMVIANFILAFELPYHAIPAWFFVGLTLSYFKYLHEHPSST